MKKEATYWELKDKCFGRALGKLKAFGFRVFICNKETRDKDYRWAYFCDVGGVLGYIQENDLGIGIDFGTIHKPTKGIGSGLSCEYKGKKLKAIYDFDREEAKVAFSHDGGWLRGEDLALVKKVTVQECKDIINGRLVEI